MTRTAVPALALVLVVAARGQTAAAFDAAEAAWLAATDATGHEVLAQRASDLFLALGPGPDRTGRLPAGARVTLMAGRAALALDLAIEARAAGDPSPVLVTTHLRALAHAGRLADFAWLVAHQARCPEAVVEALRSEEGRLLPLADAAMRAGDVVNGRFVFELLATLEPVAGYRLANLALTQRHCGEIEAARATYERARSIAPQDGDVENDYGLFLRATGQAAAATAAFWRSLELDLALPPARAGRGPAVTNLMHLEALRPGSAGPDPMPAALHALSLRPDAAMLRRVTLDVALDRLVDPAPEAQRNGNLGLPARARW